MCCRTDRYYDSDDTSIVSAYVIEKDDEIKEKFSYEILFNRTTQQSLVAYRQANYGSEAVFRHMTDEEKTNFITPPEAEAIARITEGMAHARRKLTRHSK